MSDPGRSTLDYAMCYPLDTCAESEVDKTFIAHGIIHSVQYSTISEKLAFLTP